MLHLILALVWAGTAVFIFFFDEQKGHRGNVPISLGWLAILFTLYNLVRWWGRQVTGGGAPAKGSDWKRPPTRRPGDAVSQPDPNFVFDDPPPEGPSTSAPPNGVERG